MFPFDAPAQGASARGTLRGCGAAARRFPRVRRSNRDAKKLGPVRGLKQFSRRIRLDHPTLGLPIRWPRTPTPWPRIRSRLQPLRARVILRPSLGTQSPIDPPHTTRSTGIRLLQVVDDEARTAPVGPPALRNGACSERIGKPSAQRSGGTHGSGRTPRGAVVRAELEGLTLKVGRDLARFRCNSRLGGVAGGERIGKPSGRQSSRIRRENCLRPPRGRVFLRPGLAVGSEGSSAIAEPQPLSTTPAIPPSRAVRDSGAAASEHDARDTARAGRSAHQLASLYPMPAATSEPAR